VGVHFSEGGGISCVKRGTLREEGVLCMNWGYTFHEEGILFMKRGYFSREGDIVFEWRYSIK